MASNSCSLGSFAAASVGCVLLYFISDLESVWRLCLGLGAVPGVCILYFRWKMHETARFASHAHHAAPATDYMRILRLYWRRLLGTAGCWFLLDVVFYPNVLFSATLLNLFGFASSLQRTALFNVMLTVMALPGYWTAIYLLEHVRGCCHTHTYTQHSTIQDHTTTQRDTKPKAK